MNIVLSYEPADAQFIHDNLYAYNLSKTGEPKQEITLPPEPTRGAFVAHLETEAESRCGGLVFHCEEDRFLVDFLWISDKLRGRGTGLALLQQAQQEAERRKCRLIQLFTKTFQAPEFYPKAGYKLARLEKGEHYDIYHYEKELLY